MALTAQQQALLASLEEVDAGIAPTSPPTLEELRAHGLAKPDVIALTAKGQEVMAQLRELALEPDPELEPDDEPDDTPDGGESGPGGGGREGPKPPGMRRY